MGVPALDTGYTVVRRSAATERNECVRRLHAMGVAAAVTPDGGVLGQICFDDHRFDRIDGIGPMLKPRFTCVDFSSLRFEPPDPLARLDPVRFDDLEDRGSLIARIDEAWRAIVIETEKALDRARQLATNAKIRLDPFRIEGTVRYGADMVTLLFSSKGHRACINAVGERAVVFLPSESRLILRSDTGRPTRRDPHWDAALEQATACLVPAEVSTDADRNLSVDLVSRDLGSLDLDSDDLPI